MVSSEELLCAIAARHSVRRYESRPLSADVVAALAEEVALCNRAGSLDIHLVVDERRAFAGPFAYGKFFGVANYFVMAGVKDATFAERVGYYGERLVLAAQALGLNTCWAALSYRKVKGAYALSPDAKIACKIAVGYGTTAGVQHKMKAATDISNISADSPSWFVAGVNAALLAPSAINQQKFSFEYAGVDATGRGIVRAHPGFSAVGYTHIDLGVAKLHFELAAGRDQFVWQ